MGPATAQGTNLGDEGFNKRDKNWIHFRGQVVNISFVLSRFILRRLLGWRNHRVHVRGARALRLEDDGFAEFEKVSIEERIS